MKKAMLHFAPVLIEAIPVMTRVAGLIATILSVSL